MFLVCVFSFASTLHYCVCGLTEKIILCFTTKDRAFELIRLYSEDKPMPIVYKWGPRCDFVASQGTTAALLQGRPQLRLQKSYQFQVPKTNPQN